jgi:hypothetical protein
VRRGGIWICVLNHSGNTHLHHPPLASGSALAL